MEMPEGWKRLKEQTKPLPNGLSEGPLPITQDGNQVSEQLDLMKEMAEALEKYEDDLEGIHWFNNGSSIIFRTNKAREILNKFKEWK